MSTEKQYPMTAAGKQKLEDELEYLISTKRKEVVERIKIARGFGDLSENSEYDAAKDEQGFVEGRISLLQTMIINATIIEEGSNVRDTVAIGCTVKFVELPEEDEEEYTIVGSAEADPIEGRISNDSPIAKALLGRKVGDVVKINTPGGDMEVKITSIK
ncbi:transcription elongation factor GreA [Kurthia sibirica]|uniref:Transcription elongation factor GreA n=1 Tax=Kurthia sibirica TaxID=202750 RepID=A0A2U3AJX1_9BACL|nr:transcription elongation factor GreA [Kurthia sibirica]PWI24827.1 transcription elongation factor GreA [Kurthia sibirica]GEK33327.1 transcription elongation factor GreA [Kurthia sibirica]